MSVTLCAGFLVKRSNYLCQGITGPYFPSMGKLIHTSESRCFENKMVACFEFNDLKDKESVFLGGFVNNNQRERRCSKERQCSKVNFVVNWER